MSAAFERFVRRVERAALSGRLDEIGAVLRRSEMVKNPAGRTANDFMFVAYDAMTAARECWARDGRLDLVEELEPYYSAIGAMGRRPDALTPAPAPAVSSPTGDREARDGYDAPGACRAREVVAEKLDKDWGLGHLAEGVVETLVEGDLVALNASASAFLAGAAIGLLTAAQREALLGAASDEPHVLVHARRVLALSQPSSPSSGDREREAGDR